MFLSIDQEDEKATVTLDIQRTKYKLPNGTGGKIMYPLVSVANLMDPGKNMLIESAKEDSKYFMLGLNNKDIRSRLTWNYKQPNFTINHDNGKNTVIGAYYTDAARATNNNRTTKRGYAYIIKNEKGEYRYPSNISKAKAKDGSTGYKVAKFLGDFLQALTVVSYIKNNNNDKYHYCLATGDAMLANNFIFLCSRSDVSPNLWMATSTQQVSKVYGKMIDQIQVVKPAPTQVRNAPNFLFGNEVVSSGNNRTEGNGRNAPTVKRNNRGNTMSIAGSSQGSVSRNNNNTNNVSQPPANRVRTNVSQPPAKRARNNNNTNQPPAKRARINVTQPSPKRARNNVTQPSPKRARNNVTQPSPQRAMVNVTRNNLIKNLKKNNLPNLVINGPAKRYDNKQQSVNQILRQANNSGKTAQRLGTLKRSMFSG
jgi:hypothetical protein